MNFKEFIMRESFDSISDFMLNPEHRDKKWDELIDEFEKSGGKRIGAGKYATVWSHPSWPYVLKLYSQDNYFTAFVRFAYKNPHPAFPKFIGPPQLVVPFYKRLRSQEKQYLVRMEELNPISQSEFKLIDDNHHAGVAYVRAVERGDADQMVPDKVYPTMGEKEAYRTSRKAAQEKGEALPQRPEARMVQRKAHQKIIDLIDSNPNFLKLFEGLRILQDSKLQGAPDVHQGNFMKRKNGELVIVDPYWEGANPYQMARDAHASETDAYGDWEPPAESDYIRGGDLRKKKRVKRQKPNPQSPQYDDVPF